MDEEQKKRIRQNFQSVLETFTNPTLLGFAAGVIVTVFIGKIFD